MKEAVILWLEGDGEELTKFVQWLNGHCLVAKCDEMLTDASEFEKRALAKRTVDWVETPRAAAIVPAQIAAVDPG